MKFTIVEKDRHAFYPTYKEWCIGHGFPSRHLHEIDRVFVCLNETGVMVYSVFFWETPSTFCILGFPFSNPNIPYEEKKGGLNTLLDGVAEIASEEGFYMIWTTSSTQRVEESLLQSGFEKGDLNVNQYYRVLV